LRPPGSADVGDVSNARSGSNLRVSGEKIVIRPAPKPPFP
jgi:hypothetical protein